MNMKRKYSKVEANLAALDAEKHSVFKNSPSATETYYETVSSGDDDVFDILAELDELRDIGLEGEIINEFDTAYLNSSIDKEKHAESEPEISKENVIYGNITDDEMCQQTDEKFNSNVNENISFTCHENSPGDECDVQNECDVMNGDIVSDNDIDTEDEMNLEDVNNGQNVVDDNDNDVIIVNSDYDEGNTEINNCRDLVKQTSEIRRVHEIYTMTLTRTVSYRNNIPIHVGGSVDYDY